MNDWEFSLFLEPNSDYAAAISSVLDALSSVTFELFNAEGSLPVWPREAPVASINDQRALLRLLVEQGGAFGVEHPQLAVAMDISVSSATEVLRRPTGDHVAATVSGWTFTRENRSEAWNVIHRALQAIADAAPVARVSGLSEDMVEHAASRFDAVEPADLSEWSVLGWFNLVPHGSPSAQVLTEAAEVLGLSTDQSAGFVELKLSPNPWGDDVDRFIECNDLWRSSAHGS